jgi:UDP-4-amino-4,6-dideoxy-N-acetyl-beta-L-altrosamine transaminase
MLPYVQPAWLPYARQHLSPEDKQAVLAVLEGQWLTQGPVLGQFEQALADVCQARHAVAVSHGTAALHLAYLAAGVGPGSRVWTTTNTFAATATAALMCGATVDFIDIDPATHLLSLAHLEARLEAAKRSHALPDVVVPVHFAGYPFPLARLEPLAAQYGFCVIDDAAHALGARGDDGQPIGSGHVSRMTVLSFHPVKIITTGEGGAVLTQDDALARRLRLLRSHGIERDPSYMMQRDPAPWAYEVQHLGYNYRLSDLQAALGRSQLAQLPAFLARRQQLAQQYQQGLGHLPLQLPCMPTAPGVSAWHLYVVRLLPEVLHTQSKRQVVEALHLRGIGVQVHYMPLHTQPLFAQAGFAASHCPEALRYDETAFSLPLFPGMTDAEQDRVIAALDAVLAR